MHVLRIIAMVGGRSFGGNYINHNSSQHGLRPPRKCYFTCVQWVEEVERVVRVASCGVVWSLEMLSRPQVIVQGGHVGEEAAEFETALLYGSETSYVGSLQQLVVSFQVILLYT